MIFFPLLFLSLILEKKVIKGDSSCLSNNNILSHMHSNVLSQKNTEFQVRHTTPASLIFPTQL